MELLLNLLWLALSAPAVWLWLRLRASSPERGFCHQVRPFLLLACALLLLFPVISATDDLHPMRPEMEESNPFKRVVRVGPGMSSGVRILTLVCLFICCLSVRWIFPDRVVRGLAVWNSGISPQRIRRNSCASRAPPAFCLGW